MPVFVRQGKRITGLTGPGETGRRAIASSFLQAQHSPDFTNAHPGARVDIAPELIPLVAIVMGISVVLIPVIGYTARYVLRPFEQTLTRYLEARAADDTVRVLERRMSLMEQQLETMESTLNRVAEAADFHRELRAPRTHAPAAIPAPPNDARP